MDFIADILEKSKNIFINIQNTDGGIPYNNEGSPSGTWTSCGTLWIFSMMQADNVPIGFYNQLSSYISANQNTDGLMSYTSKNDMGCIDATAQYILGAVLLKGELLKKNKNIVIKSVRGMISCVGESGWPTIKGCIPNVFSTSLSIIALSKAAEFEFVCKKIDKAELTNLVISKLNVLINLQNDDGGWGSTSEDNVSRVAPTAMALIAVKTCCSDLLTIKADVLEKAKNYLVKTQNKDGGWDDVIERDVGFTVIRQSTPYCLGALALADCPIAEINFQTGLYNLINMFDGGRLFYKNSNIITWSTRDGIFALCCLRDAFFNSANGILNLLDFNMKTSYCLDSLKTELEKEQTEFAEYRKDVEKTFEEKIHQKIMSIRGRYLFFQITLSISFFAIAVLADIMLKLCLGWDMGWILAASAVFFAIWGTLTALIFRKGVDDDS